MGQGLVLYCYISICIYSRCTGIIIYINNHTVYCGYLGYLNIGVPGISLNT